MAIIITDECINCGACEPECPNNAIYEGGVEWRMSDGTTISGSYKLEDGSAVLTQGVVIPGIIKSVSNNTRAMKNSKATEYRIATVQTWNPSTETLETKSEILS